MTYTYVLDRPRRVVKTSVPSNYFSICFSRKNLLTIFCYSESNQLINILNRTFGKYTRIPMFYYILVLDIFDSSTSQVQIVGKLRQSIGKFLMFVLECFFLVILAQNLCYVDEKG